MFGVVGGLFAPVVLAHFLGAPISAPVRVETPALHVARAAGSREASAPSSVASSERLPDANMRRRLILLPSLAQPEPQKIFELRSRRWDGARFKRLDTFVEPSRRGLVLAPHTCVEGRLMAVVTGLALLVGRGLSSGGTASPSAGGGEAPSTVRPALTRNTVGVALDF